MVDANLPDEEYHANLPQPRGRMRGGDGVLEPQPATAYFTGSSDSARDDQFAINRKNEVQDDLRANDLRQQGDGIKRDGQTSPARDRRPVVG